MLKLELYLSCASHGVWQPLENRQNIKITVLANHNLIDLVFKLIQVPLDWTPLRYYYCVVCKNWRTLLSWRKCRQWRSVFTGGDAFKLCMQANCHLPLALRLMLETLVCAPEYYKVNFTEVKIVAPTHEISVTYGKQLVCNCFLQKQLLRKNTGILLATKQRPRHSAECQN